ncbi:MAG: hypothetical protein R2712_00155 [Vicinamibacterales bacterium]
MDVVMVYQAPPATSSRPSWTSGRGPVIAGAGRATSGTQGGIEHAASKGVFVVTATRRPGRPHCAEPGGQGPANLTPAQQRRRAFSISAEDHILVKARILL